MNKVQYYLIHLTLLVQAVIWFILGVYILFCLENGITGNQAFRTILNVFLLLTVLLAIEFALSVKTYLGKQYWETFSKRTSAASIQRENERHLQELKDFDYSILPKYSGRNIFPVRSTFFIMWSAVMLGVVTIIFVVLAIAYREYIALAPWAMFLGVFALVARKHLSTKIMIDEIGAHLIKKRKVSKTFKWNKIKSIGISPNVFGYNSVFVFMYISTRTLENDVEFDEYDEEKYLILTKPNVKIIHCLQKYWSKEIVNLDTQKNWLKYINKL